MRLDVFQGSSKKWQTNKRKWAINMKNVISLSNLVYIKSYVSCCGSYNFFVVFRFNMKQNFDLLIFVCFRMTSVSTISKWFFHSVGQWPYFKVRYKALIVLCSKTFHTTQSTNLFNLWWCELFLWYNLKTPCLSYDWKLLSMWYGFNTHWHIGIPWPR